ncbi:hypothetical protein PPL_01058 [Heterostelium album PN500]|uniref:EGF-like domain-containing protein n=1 Tax=Heterostelium pallidum (strain ATCC 26659 / Pp 5 / PN500) TaxID=670386 RepID=D3AY00_HETP5|nr:hypothetical protein PPL_01058 [Heterostelium album PN500]EFA85827.1 hypothetical protein PPL_01058 [Heterostelium album PN500]|eukprot:XP_020437933.1 hypothetical protein PPL_01058 [Heterostelium album PN500]
MREQKCCSAESPAFFKTTLATCLTHIYMLTLLTLSDFNILTSSAPTLSLNFQNLQSLQITFTPHNLTAPPTPSSSILDLLASQTCTDIQISYDNTITTIPQDLLTRVPKLQSLDLSGNQLTYINLNQPSSSLKSLSINIGLLGLLDVSITPLNFPNLIDLSLTIGNKPNTTNNTGINIVVEFGGNNGSLVIDSPVPINNLTIPTNLSKIELNTTKINILNGQPTDNGTSIPESYCNYYDKANFSLPYSLHPAFNISCGPLKYPIVTGASPLLSNDTIVILNGLFGNSSLDDVIVSINGEHCNIESYSESQIKCSQNLTEISGTVPLIVSVNGNNFTSNSIVNIVNTESSKTNSVVCKYGSINQNGECECLDGYKGIDCSSVVFKANYSQNVRKPEATFTIENGKLNFSLVEIQEIGSKDNIIRNLSIESYFQQGYNISIESDIKYVNSSGYQYFSDQKLFFDEGTSKATINITGWPYLVSSSHLRVIFKMNFDFSSFNSTNQTDSLIPTITSDTPIGEPFVNYYISYGDVTFYSRFLTIVLSDGVKSFSMIEMMTLTADSMIIGVHLPQCKECLIDPDWGVLVKTLDSSEESKSRKGANNNIFAKSWVIITISTVGGTVLIFTLFATVVTVIKIRKHKKEKDSITKIIDAFKEETTPNP